MGTVTTHLESQARSIFSDLGYDVTDDGHEIRAERKWRVVSVMTMPEPADAPPAGDLRCFVTWADNTDALVRRLRGQDLPYEWAVISVTEDGDYEVCERTGE